MPVASIGRDQAPGSSQPRRLKVLVSVDMEGVAGVVTGEQLGPAGFEYGRFREFMTREALSAVEAARAAGATEIVVADAHGNGQNLLIDQFPSDVRIIRSWPRRLGMVAGVDDAVDALVFIGYHAGTNNPAGADSHSIRFRAKDMVEASAIMQFIGEYRPDITP
jgi:D-amino peptidase